MIVRLLVISSMVLSSSTALAKEHVDEPAMQLALQKNPSSDEKSPAVAVALSCITTFGVTGLGVGLLQTEPLSGLAMMALGVAVGPSIGHLYAGEVGHGLLTAGLRLGLGVGGGLLMLGGLFSGLDCEGSDSACDSGEGLFVGGMVALGGAAVLAVYDLFDSGFAAVRANHRRVSVTPLVGRSRDQSYYGVGLSGRF
jgi:hypothetical protein